MTTPTTTAVFDGLQPTTVWRLFGEMTTVPRESKREEKIRAHLRALADEHGFALREDSVGNLVIVVPATKGAEQAPIVVLQGHVDMVCEKSPGCTHNFDEDPIPVVKTTDEKTGEEIIAGDNTTLGADNGIGLALGLAAAIEKDVVHGPLELLCTADEEAGMTGAKALEPSLFEGRTMINLDSEEDDALYIGCAGGCDATLAWSFPSSGPQAGESVARIVVGGLRGGHSGGDVHEGRGSAIRLLARTLSRIEPHGLRIGGLAGGSKRNAIPRDASALISGPAGVIEAVVASATKVQAEGREESLEPGLTISVETDISDQASLLLSASDTDRLLRCIHALPHGVLGMHPKVPELVQTSNNVATIECVDEGGKQTRVVIGCLARSSSGTRIQEAADQISAVGQLAGADVTVGNEYPGWEPNPDSPVLKTCQGVYEKLFGASPKVMAIHAGLECGIIGERVGKIDMVSFGPHITGAHAPGERVYVASVEKTWRYLKAVLAELAKA